MVGQVGEDWWSSLKWLRCGPSLKTLRTLRSTVKTLRTLRARLLSLSIKPKLRFSFASFAASAVAKAMA